MQASFREILEEKLDSPLENTHSPKEKSQYSDPFALSFLMGSIPQFKYQTGHYTPSNSHHDSIKTEDFFHRNSSEADNQKDYNHHEPIEENITQNSENFEPKYTLDGLTVTAMTAIYSLKSLGAEINDTFTFSDLKKQYRRLLLRYHPDHNNGALPEEFYDLRQAYDSLISELGDI